MRLFYNGVELKVLSTLPGTKRVVVRDRSGLHYLYTKWIFDVICLYNPAGTTAPAALAAAFPLASVVTTPGPLGRGSPAFTDSQLRDLLRQDRKQLLVFSEDGQYVLQSPQPATGTALATLNVAANTVTIPLPTLDCDATGGPRIMKCDIVEAHGIKSYTIHFQIETDVCEFTGAEVLSHSWNTRLSVDQDFQATRLISGELKFRLDEMERLRAADGRLPDSYRTLFGHPCPDFFARTNIDVFEHDDKCTVSYQVTDTQRHFNLGSNSPATRFEAFLMGSMEQQGISAVRVRTLAGVAERMADLGYRFMQGGTISQRVVDIGSNILSSESRIAFESCPQYNHTVVVRAWGPTFVARTSLMAMCLGIAYGRLGLSPDSWRTEALQITHELSGKFVEVQVNYAFGLEDVSLKGGFLFQIGKGISEVLGNLGAKIDTPLGRIGGQEKVGFVLAGPGPTEKLLSPFTLPETLAGAGVGAAAVGAGGALAAGGTIWASQTALTKNRPMPWNRGATGTWLGQLVAQVLYDGATSPPDVPDVANQTGGFVDPDTGILGAPVLTAP